MRDAIHDLGPALAVAFAVPLGSCGGCEEHAAAERPIASADGRATRDLQSWGRDQTEAGEPEQPLHLAEMALASDPTHRGALTAKLAALRLLMERSGDVNHSEVFWLRDASQRTRAELGGPGD